MSGIQIAKNNVTVCQFLQNAIYVRLALSKVNIFKEICETLMKFICFLTTIDRIKILDRYSSRLPN